MICPHCEIGSYFGTCTCKVANIHCPFMRRCNMEHKWLPLDSMNTCARRTKANEVSRLMANEHRVEFESKGKLYININGQMKRIPNPFDHTPKAVELVEVDGQWYIKGYEPKPVVKEESKVELEFEVKKLDVDDEDKLIRKDKSTDKKKKVSKRASIKKGK